MVIGFVSAGVISLPVAIAIIFGANIGTTITAQIIAFKLSNYIYVFIFIGFLISFVVKNQKWKNIGISIFAFGLLFLGIETMGGVMKPLAKSTLFIQMMEKVSDIPILGVLTGALIFIWIIPIFAKFVQAVSPKGIGISVISRQIANAHTIFNVAMTIIWIPLLKVMVKIVNRLVKNDGQKNPLPVDSMENLLNYRLLNEPESALLLIQSKVDKVLDFANITKEKISENKIEDEQEFFDEVLFVQREGEKLMNYITALIATNNLNNEQAVLCEELIIKLSKAEKKLNKAVKKGVK
ncbi:MAG: Na/Pi cotransporter family protein [Treponema sp.]|nr:Na/Pi cotransporter family protein [Treponema sp.]